MKNIKFVYPFEFIEEETGYFIKSIDIQGVYTKTDEKDYYIAIKMAQEVLGMSIADMIENGEEIPKPSDIKNIKSEYGFLTLITIDINDYIRDNVLVKKTLSIPKWANDLGIRMNLNFSKILTEKILEYTSSK